MSVRVIDNRVSALSIVFVNGSGSIYYSILGLSVVIRRVVANHSRVNTVNAVAALPLNCCVAMGCADVGAFVSVWYAFV